MAGKEPMTIFEKLLAVQCELKAPKSQYNSFGKYNYRNCEDILEAAKPLLNKYKAVVFLSDTIEMIGNRFYVKATASFYDTENPDFPIEVTAYAREEDSKKGMDASQVTGASSSYARKYALNGLFDIDDTKDSDTTNNGQDITNAPTKANEKTSKSTASKPNKPKNTSQELSQETRNALNSLISEYRKITGYDIKNILGTIQRVLGFSVNDVNTEEQAMEVKQFLNKLISESLGEGA